MFLKHEPNMGPGASRDTERGQKDAELDAGPRIWCQEAPWTKEKMESIRQKKKNKPKNKKI